MALEELFSGLFSCAGILGVCLVLFSILLFSFHGSVFSGPGPWGVPIFGYFPFLRKNVHIQLHELAKKYGPVYKINICGQTFIYMESIKAVRESHINKSEDFPHRNDKSSILSDAFREGLVIIKGDQWKTLRKFLNQSLRDMGLHANKEELRGPIEDSVKSIVDTLLKSGGEPVDLVQLFCGETTRAVVKLFLGDDVSEEDVQQLDKNYFDIFMPFTDAGLMLIGNFASYFVLPWINGYKRHRKGVQDMNRLLHKMVNERMASFDPNQKPGNVIEAFLREKDLREKKGDPTAKYFTNQSLVSTLMQAYGDGSTGVGLFVAIYVFELCKRPDVQDAVYKEIVDVVGTERLPTLDDRPKMPFTNSTIKELQRVSLFFPVFPGLECVKDTTVDGVHVPKGSVVLLNYWAAHNDPNLYENPEQFDATRFLPDKPKTESPITFGVGKRSCAGERLVMAELFLFLTSIFQNFMATVEDDRHNVADSFHSGEMNCLVRLTPRKK